VGKLQTAEPGASGLIMRVALLGGWIGLCDLWLKLMARAGGCADPSGVVDMLGHPLTIPEQCSGTPLLGEAIRLAPGIRNGGPFGLAAPSLAGGTGQLWALALLALATTVTILIVRWRWRTPGDGLALGALWGGAATLAIPRLVAGGEGLFEFTVSGAGAGVGDIALVLALVWLAWRWIAEARA